MCFLDRGNLCASLLTGFLIGLACGCAVKEPVLYPNSQYQATGEQAAQQAVQGCIELARDNGVEPKEKGRTGKTAAKGAAIGGAAAGAYGVFQGDWAGRALAGAAAGAAGGATQSAVTSDEPAPTYKRFVSRCLAEQGYEVIGWQ